LRSLTDIKNASRRAFHSNSTMKRNLTDIRTVIRLQEKQHFEQLLRPSNIARVNVRVVDLCVLLMSGENTCHHSDHAVTRCLAYGLGVSFRATRCDCKSFDDILKILRLPSGHGNETSQKWKRAFAAVIPSFSTFFPQMCWLRECDTRVHLTCHRHRPVSRTDSNPVRFRHLKVEDLKKLQALQEKADELEEEEGGVGNE